MRRSPFVLLFVLTIAALVSAQAPPSPPPQTARQALLEVFLSRNPEALVKHLPESTRHALVHKGDSITASMMVSLSSIGQELTRGGRKLETFEDGPILAICQNENDHQKFEIVVERDELQGEDDFIELSLRNYRDGHIESLPVVPRLLFAMRQEKKVWRLNEITAEAHIPLTDPDYLDTLHREQNKSYERIAPSHLEGLLATEQSYSQKHPARGYTCKLSELFPAQRNTNLDTQAALFDAGMADPDRDGYSFVLSGCVGSPVLKFQIAAVPQEADSGLKAFCTDESGVIRFTQDGTAATCFNAGEKWSQNSPTPNSYGSVEPLP
jgi:hypothetical protein